MSATIASDESSVLLIALGVVLFLAAAFVVVLAIGYALVRKKAPHAGASQADSKPPDSRSTP